MMMMSMGLGLDVDSLGIVQSALALICRSSALAGPRPVSIGNQRGPAAYACTTRPQESVACTYQGHGVCYLSCGSALHSNPIQTESQPPTTVALPTDPGSPWRLRGGVRLRFCTTLLRRSYSY